MKQVKVILELWFEMQDASDAIFAQDMEDIEKIETAFALMEEDGPFDWVNNLKNFNPKQFVENLYLEDLGTVTSAKWLEDGKIEFIIDLNEEQCKICTKNTDSSIVKHIKDALLDEPLEDGYWEGEDNGWVIHTKPLADGSTYEYGLIDYRREKNICVEIINPS